MSNVKKHHFRKGIRHIESGTKLSPTVIILLGFISLILVGALLLSLPIASAGRSFTNPIDALFTAVSSTCVTGLVTLDTGVYWSAFGKTVIIMLIQIGGLGFMTMAVMMSMFIKRQITPRERILAAQSLGLTGVGGTVKLVKRILIGTFAAEGLGAILFAVRFVPLFGWARGIAYSVFHSVSFFCNAGFDILDGTGGYGGGFSSLISFSGDPLIVFTAVFLIVFGGIGFVVWDDFYDLITKRDPLTVYTKFILTLTAILVFGGTVIILASEWSNPETVGNLPFGEKLMTALFQSVTTRTAGVDMINQSSMTDVSKLFSMILMFIGGVSGSTAGGIKVGTFGVLVLAIVSFAKGLDDVVMFRRRIPHSTVIRALAIVGIDLAAVIAAATVINLSSGVSMTASLYEAISGIATVGLSLGVTPTLAVSGKIAVMILMFFGRVGVLTVTYSLLLKNAKAKSLLRYPDINLMIG